MGGECKPWIQIIVDRASGQTSYLPKNYIRAGDTYNKAKWYDSSNIEVVWQAADQTPARFPDTIKPGHIIQFRFLGHNNADSTRGLHTALIESADSASMTWIDANWKRDSLVIRHDISLSKWSEEKIAAWTVYQVK